MSVGTFLFLPSKFCYCGPDLASRYEQEEGESGLRRWLNVKPIEA